MKQYRNEIFSFLMLMAGVLLEYAQTSWFALPYVSLVWFLAAVAPVGLPVMAEAWEHLMKKEGFNAVRVLWPLYAQRHCLQKLNKKAERKYYTVLEFKILMMALAIVVASSSVFCLPKETRIVPRAYSSER